MRILLVDNGTKHLSLFRKLVPDAELVIAKPANLKDIKTGEYTAMILSGSSVNSVIGHEEYYWEELDLIREASVPIIGICLGLELVARAYGAPICRLQEKIEGWQKIEVAPGQAILPGRNEYTVYEGHRWVVTGLSPELTGIARSKHGWEVIKHNRKPVFGMQFHPEVNDGGADGREIFLHIFNMLLKIYS